MSKQQQISDGILMIRYKVEHEKIADFDIWKSNIESVLETFSGFVSLSVLRPAKNSDFHYIIVRFDTREHAHTWMHSEERTSLLADSHATWMSERQEVIHEWDIFWYSAFRRTKKWKHWALTFLVVYPLTLLMPQLVNFIADITPLYFFGGIARAFFFRVL